MRGDERKLKWLEGGRARIVETGPFDELMRRNGFFAELVAAQFAPAVAG